MITESVIAPVRVVWPEGLEADPLAQAPRPTTLLLGPPTDPASLGPAVVLDFGVELHGGLRFAVVEVLRGAACWLRVRLGESVTEAMVGNAVDQTVEVKAGSTLDSGVTGYRFARIDLEDPALSARITVPTAYHRVAAIARLGSFSSADPQLDQIWEVGARTTHLCMQDHLWDGIKRGRTVWAGDLHPAAAVVAAVFGPQPVVEASLDHLRDNTASRPGPAWMNGIPAYSLWWIITQAEWYLASGDRTYLQTQHRYLSSLVDVLAEQVDAAGGERFEGWRYLDWATTRDMTAIHAGYQGLTAWASRSARSLALALGDPGLHERAGQVLARVEAYHPPATTSKAAAALLVLGGLADPAATNRATLAPNPLADLTPFLGYHVLEARALAGDHAGAMALIRAYWGGMIDLGATTFWEDFDVDWVAGSGRIDAVVPAHQRDIHVGLGRNTQRGLGLSLCHAWSAGPTAWLSRHVLGIQPLEPGCRAVLIHPHLGDLAHASGSFPTPLGVIHVRHQRQPDGSIATEFDAPAGVAVTVAGRPGTKLGPLGGTRPAETPPPPPAEPGSTPRPRRRWWWLSVRSLMLVVLIVGGLIGWEANRVSRMRRAIGQLGQLRTLQVASRRISDNGLIPVGRLLNLEHLKIDSSKISDAGIKHLTGLSRLESLSLRARVSGAGIATLRAAIPTLRTVSNQFVAGKGVPTPAPP